MVVAFCSFWVILGSHCNIYESYIRMWWKNILPHLRNLKFHYWFRKAISEVFPQPALVCIRVCVGTGARVQVGGQVCVHTLVCSIMCQFGSELFLGPCTTLWNGSVPACSLIACQLTIDSACFCVVLREWRSHTPCHFSNTAVWIYSFLWKKKWYPFQAVCISVEYNR
jgi:hypothetical protein